MIQLQHFMNSIQVFRFQTREDYLHQKKVVDCQIQSKKESLVDHQRKKANFTDRIIFD